MGRPTIYTPELRDAICRELASGKTLRAVCRMDNMPERPTIYDWYCRNIGEVKNEAGEVIERGFSYHYDHAREIGLDEVADETMEIADSGEDDYVEIEVKGKTKISFDKEAVLRSRLRVDNRWRYLENMAPRKYGKNVKVSNQTLDDKGEPTNPVGFDAGGVAAAVLAALQAAGGQDEGSGG